MISANASYGEKSTEIFINLLKTCLQTSNGKKVEILTTNLQPFFLGFAQQ